MLNIRDTEDQKVYVTSDTHFHHAREFVWEARGHASVDEHDNAVIDGINKEVRPNDVLFHLGDFCLNTNIDQFNQFADRINCQNIIMLWGNHNSPHQKNVYLPLVKKVLGNAYTSESEVYPLKYKNITFAGHYLEIILNGQFCVLFHYPISIFNEMSHASWLLVGHSHYGFDISTAENTTSKILDCGWDGHGKPLSFKEIKTIMDKKGIIKLDHH